MVALRRSGSSFALLALLATAACTDNASTSPYTPYTGINIDSTALVVPYGCGTGPGEVYQYLAIVSYAPLAEAGPDAALPTATGLPVAAVFDCYTNGVFENLPLPSSSPSSYGFSVDVYGYDFASAAGLGCSVATCAISTDVAIADEAFANWSTTAASGHGCQVTEEVGAAAFATCAPLVPTGTPTAGTDGGADDGSISDALAQTGVDATVPDALAETGNGD